MASTEREIAAKYKHPYVFLSSCYFGVPVLALNFENFIIIGPRVDLVELYLTGALLSSSTWVFTSFSTSGELSVICFEHVYYPFGMVKAHLKPNSLNTTQYDLHM